MKKTLLIVDDIEILRIPLKSIFEDEYNVLEASNGKEALSLILDRGDVAAVLLDMQMPVMDGLETLKAMSSLGILTRIPVYIITAENDHKKLLEAYNLGAVDVINKNYIPLFLKRSVSNMIELYRQRNCLQTELEENLNRLNYMNRRVIEELAETVEFRSVESGEHVKKVCGYTDILMTAVSSRYAEYRMSRETIDKIVFSAILHDVGKIAIPDSILNKPGPLTKEEFEVMKTHTIKGCEHLKHMQDIMEKDIFDFSYDICRYHHERYDGSGYPDHLKGDNIPIWSQIVAVADCYDALTSHRVYKDALSHKESVEMILKGDCGTFGPKVMEVFKSKESELEDLRRKNQED